MSGKYKHIFFDLDRTLWDFDNNSLDALGDLVIKYELLDQVKEIDNFIKVYRTYNDELWGLYREKKLVKRILRWKRFHLALLKFGIDNEELAKQMGEDYLKISATKRKLFPNTHEILDYLHKSYKLHIITNGFEEVQHLKLSNCNLDKYFDKVITSEKVEAHKPKPIIFEYALREANALVEESIMIGDDYRVDIEGAMNVNMDQVFFNPNGIKPGTSSKPTFEVKSLIDIKEIL